MIILVALMAMMAVGGVAFAFAGGDERTQKRVSAVAKSKSAGRAASKAQAEAQKRKSVATLLKDVEKNQAAMRAKNKPTLRRRLEQAGFTDASPRNFWIASGGLGLVAALICFLTGQSMLVTALAAFVAGFGLPRWVLNFLFNRRKGHCEYFASSMAVMVRTLGIPSRVVTGFQSGVFNPVSGQQLIRASDAHSWVEVWIPNRGWTVFDPTPPDYSLHRPSLFSQLSLYLDAAEVFWQEWVLNYSLDHQLVLAARMEDPGER